MLNRRQLLQSAGAAGLALAWPSWARADEPRRGERVLVFLHLKGGNDGLNTVVPFADPHYRLLRPTLALTPRSLLRLDEALALHPELSGLRTLWERERLAIVNGVGYPQPSYSHFRSTEVWYTAQPERAPTEGWLARALAARPRAAPLRAVGLAKERPLSLSGDAPGIVTLSEFSRFRVPRELAGLTELYAAYGQAPGMAGAAGRAAAEALQVARRIARLRPAQGPFVGRLGQSFRKVVALLEADLPLEVIQFEQGGYDTHADQLGPHAGLLSQLSDNLLAFQERLEQSGLAERVVTVVFSEFGRRAAENVSGGTDHGAAGPVFVLGHGLRAGFHGAQPSLAELDAGNLRFTTDLRALYASLLSSVLELDPAPLVGEFPPLPLFV